ncbi:DUF485 domain-containing protein [Burkholderia pseudomultivorans]|uniref:DUF485 domain-containing protein n=1 Tax=Burkholderia pseudomultivorans TaxID=1207504 RepID=A0A132F060_9BURK|nr:DUF485 domain-containing protein [Burkholderia pseudomultivorans]AOI93449.1 hypothetical protein WS57_33130 [Burkholderia pseudomultivorans]KVC38817.1 hypothetical protein WS55_26255 [Burkholderia pseudomultivorans]KVC41299.1 hypothetical protein WS56_32825 [Burkholderia pseudomultivorans]KVC54957.1 hypothetical protein WS58_31500 [Burkholderia pseudomultivorans]KVG61444.1 hypothetical protein WS80_28610 [Burkholderia pseudomultivorans]
MELSVIESVTARRDYQQLVRARRRFSFVLTALMIATYYGFILLVALAPHVLAAPLYRGATTTVGIVAGVAIIAIAIGLTACYVLRANRAFDRQVDAILART